MPLPLKINQDQFVIGLIIVLTIARVITSRVLGCPEFFDCNSYIYMMHNFSYDPSIPGHHAMRVLPSMLAGLLNKLGLSVPLSFQVISGLAYIGFGVGVYWVSRQLKKPVLFSLAICLLALSLHHAMKIPLNLVYQSCDMLSFPISLFIIYFSFNNNLKQVFLLSLVGIFIRQNLFVLGVLSIMYCLITNKQLKQSMYLVLLILAYSLLQIYYHATGTFSALLDPPDNFFTLGHISSVIKESYILDLFICFAPIVIFNLKQVVKYLVKYWHITLYAAITIGQPILAFHMTGNNLPRLALQGVWVIFFIAALSLQSKQPKNWQWVLLVYAGLIFSTWDIQKRLVMTAFVMLVFSIIFIWENVYLKDGQGQ